VGGHSGSVLALAFSPDGRKVVSSGSDRTVRLWEAGREVARRGELERPPVVLAFTGPERVLLGTGRAEGEDPAVRVWDAREKDEPVRLPGRELIQVLAFAPDGKGVLVAEGSAVRFARLP